MDDNGKVLPEVVKVMEICAEANIILATGHSSPDESITLIRKPNVSCGKCIAKCSQKLDIPNLLAKVKETMGR